MKYIKVGVLAFAGLLVLSACGSEESKEVQKAKEDFKVLYSYEESKIMPVINEEKTSEELAQEYLEDKIGLNSESEDTRYKEQGVKEDQGIFVESAIYEGNQIPNVTAMSEETRERLKNDREDRSLEQREEEYAELKADRQKILEEQYADDNTNKELVEDEIKNLVEEYEQDSEEGKDNNTEDENKNESEDNQEGEDEEDFEYEEEQGGNDLFDE